MIYGSGTCNLMGEHLIKTNCLRSTLLALIYVLFNLKPGIVQHSSRERNSRMLWGLDEFSLETSESFSGQVL